MPVPFPPSLGLAILKAHVVFQEKKSGSSFYAESQQ